MKRYSFIDSLRGLAIIAVIIIHITGTYVSGKNSNIALVFNQLSRFAVPVFFLISGWGLTISNKGEGTYLVFLRKQVVKILVPYIIWSFIYIVFNTFILGKSTTLQGIILDFITGDTFYHLYYIPVLFFFYLIYPLVNKTLRIKNTIFLYFLITLLSQYLKVEVGGLFALNQNIFNWIFYFAFGAWLAKDFSSKLTWLQKNKILSLVFLISSICLLFADIYLRGDYSQLRWAVIPFSLSITLLFVSYNINSKILNFYGKHSFDLYLVHPLIIRTLRGVLNILGLEISPIVTMLLTIIVLFIGLHAFIWFVSSSKFQKIKEKFKKKASH